MTLNSDRYLKVQDLLRQIHQNQPYLKELVLQLLEVLQLFHIYELERALTSLDERVRMAALKKLEKYIPDLLCNDIQKQKKAVLALEQHFEPVKILDEDA